MTMPTALQMASVGMMGDRSNGSTGLSLAGVFEPASWPVLSPTIGEMEGSS